MIPYHITPKGNDLFVIEKMPKMPVKVIFEDYNPIEWSNYNNAVQRAIASADRKVREEDREAIKRLLWELPKNSENGKFNFKNKFVDTECFENWELEQNQLYELSGIELEFYEECCGLNGTDTQLNRICNICEFGKIKLARIKTEVKYSFERPTEGGFIGTQIEVKVEPKQEEQAKDSIGLDSMTNEEKTKWFEANLSPLIRYGYSEAINELLEWLGQTEHHALRNKLHLMITNKRQLNWDRLREESKEQSIEPVKRESQEELIDELITLYSKIMNDGEIELGTSEDRAIKAVKEQFTIQRK